MSDSSNKVTLRCWFNTYNAAKNFVHVCGDDTLECVDYVGKTIPYSQYKTRIVKVFDGFQLVQMHNFLHAGSLHSLLTEILVGDVWMEIQPTVAKQESVENYSFIINEIKSKDSSGVVEILSGQHAGKIGVLTHHIPVSKCNQTELYRISFGALSSGDFTSEEFEII